ncbi:MAG: hypothetical protein JW726_10905 [Anaerolineales bacterium]|nr:hypothetical protein [Anaerolineales bacterium]
MRNESPSIPQWGGILLAVVGALVYFLPLVVTAMPVISLAAALVGLLANSVSAVLGRRANQQSQTCTPVRQAR